MASSLPHPVTFSPEDLDPRPKKRARQAGVLPSPPANLLGDRNAATSQFLEQSVPLILKELADDQAVHDLISPLKNSILQKVKVATATFHMGEAFELDPLLQNMKELLMLVADPKETRRSRITDLCSSVVSNIAIKYFLDHGTLVSNATLGTEYGLTFSDSEYLLGVISFARELERYSVGRATLADVRSVMICKQLVGDLLGLLMGFDFRNGPIRRQYDGVKYAAKRMEDILYELSLGKENREKDGVEEESYDFSEIDFVDKDEFAAMQSRMSSYDALREDVIKKSRDVQKLSKNSVYSLHRGGKNMAQARTQLDQAKEKAIEIATNYLEKEPTLRSGTYANALEEWAEGRLYEHWLTQHGALMSLADMRKEVHVTVDEYVGGLGDFTGEVGRWAVAAATKRDIDGVTKAMSAVMEVTTMVLQIGEGGNVPGRLAKKVGALRTNLSKLEHLRYELALVKGSNRKTFSVSAPSASTAKAGIDDENDQ